MVLGSAMFRLIQLYGYNLLFFGFWFHMTINTMDSDYNCEQVLISAIIPSPLITQSNNGEQHGRFLLNRLQPVGQRPGLPLLQPRKKNLLRHEDGVDVTRSDIEALCNWDPKADPSTEIAFTPSRVVLQDFTGVPAVVDLAAMRDAMVSLGGDANQINPLSPAELVIDHSVQVDSFGKANSLDLNNQIEFQRNNERYSFLRWGQSAFSNFRVVPPNTGIVHQVNLEFPHHHDQRHWRTGLGRWRH
jgi:hypothetical protein